MADRVDDRDRDEKARDDRHRDRCAGADGGDESEREEGSDDCAEDGGEQ